MAADRSDAQADIDRRDARKFWIAVAVIVAIGLLFVWWSTGHPLLNE
jgi:hypothetical protein